MGSTVVVPHRWGTREYASVVGVSFQDPELHVSFADGCTVVISVEEFDNAYLNAQRPDWPRASVGEYEVVVPTAEGESAVFYDYA